MFRVIKVIVLLSCVNMCSVQAGDLSAYVKETQMVDSTNKKFTMIWWMPKSYWAAALRDNPQLSESAKGEMADLFDKHIFIVVVRMDISIAGAFMKSGEEITTDTITCFYNSVQQKRITDSELNEDTSRMIAAIKPGLAKSLGQIGEGMEFYAFENPLYGKGKLIENTEGRIDFSAFGKKLRIRLPLAADLPPVIDQETGDSFPGNYKFNPYTGKRI